MSLLKESVNNSIVLLYKDKKLESSFFLLFSLLFHKTIDDLKKIVITFQFKYIHQNSSFSSASETKKLNPKSCVTFV